MRTLKVMSIVGMAIALLGLVCMVGFNNPYDYDAAIGWGILVTLYFIAFSIVTLVQSVKKK